RNAARQCGTFSVLRFRYEAVLDAIRVKVDSEHLSCRIDAKDSGTLTRLGTRHRQRIVHRLDDAVDTALEAYNRGCAGDVVASEVESATRNCSRGIDGRETEKGPRLRRVKSGEGAAGRAKEGAIFPILATVVEESSDGPDVVHGCGCGAGSVGNVERSEVAVWAQQI